MKNNFDVSKRVVRPAWEHHIETYQGSKKGRDWGLIIGAVFLIGFGLVCLIALV